LTETVEAPRRTGLAAGELEALFSRLAEAVDSTQPERRPVMLAKAFLLLADNTGAAEAATRSLAAACVEPVADGRGGVR
jgi:hypothetical protein